MSAFAEKVKRYYDLGLWTDSKLRNAVEKAAITEDEYKAITGQEYLG